MLKISQRTYIKITITINLVFYFQNKMGRNTAKARRCWYSKDSDQPGHSCSLISLGCLHEPFEHWLPIQFLTNSDCTNVQANQYPVYLSFEPRHDKTNKMTVRPAKTQISLGICPVWSESLLCAQCVGKDPSFLHADSEDSDQTGPRLIWVFAGRTLTLLILSWGGSFGKIFCAPANFQSTVTFCSF